MPSTFEEMSTSDWVGLVTAATGVVGPGEGEAWRAKLEATALELARSARYLAQAAPHLSRRELTGRVVGVEDPAVSQSGETLDLARVTIRAGTGKHPDQMWVDRRSAAGRQLIAAALAAQGKDVRFVKESQVRRHGDDLETDGGQVKSLPYLAEICLVRASGVGVPGSAADGVGAGVSRDAAVPTGAAAPVAAPTPAPTATPAPAPAPAAVGGEAAGGGDPSVTPQTLKELVTCAEQILGIGLDGVASTMVALCGPKGPSGRSADDVAKVWAALRAARLVGVAA